MTTTPPPQKTAPEAVRKQATTWLDTHGRTIAESPFPALASCVTALAMYPAARKHQSIYPRPLLIFAGAWGASGWMTYNGYPVDGAGTMAAWSSLYLIVNGWQRSVKPLWKARAVGPVILATWSFGTAVVGGWYWSNTNRYVPEAGGK